MSTGAGDVVERVAALCRRYEGFRTVPYLCPAGVPTIGYGATVYLDGRKVQIGDKPISKEAAEVLLLRQITRVYLPGVQRMCPGLPNGPLAAATDFAFNLGLTRLWGSTLRTRLIARDWSRSADELRKWVWGGGKKLPGLILRREAEVKELFNQ